MAATEPIRQKKQVDALVNYYLRRGKHRNYLLIVMGIYTALRISDLLALNWGDVYDFESGRFRQCIRLSERKTGKAKTIALNKRVIYALKLCLANRESVDDQSFLFAGNRKSGKAISRVQAWRIIHQAASDEKIPGTVGCHSLRKTFGYHAWKAGVHVAVIMDIYNHASFMITRRYLGICQDDIDKVYLHMRFSA